MKNGTLENACFTIRREVADLAKSANMHIVKLINNQKKSKKNDDKSAVVFLI